MAHRRFTIEFNSFELVDWLEDELESYNVQLEESQKKLLTSKESLRSIVHVLYTCVYVYVYV